ncbi:phytanoyl-CoA dioxygenase family protein [Nocardia asteroides]
MSEIAQHSHPTGESTTARPLSVDLVEQYRRDGYVRVPGILRASEVAEYLADARNQLDRQRTISWDAPEGGNVMDWVPEPENASALMRKLALHSEITGIAERLAGQPLRMFKSELLRKHTSDSAPTPLHMMTPPSRSPPPQ